MDVITYPYCCHSMLVRGPRYLYIYTRGWLLLMGRGHKSTHALYQTIFYMGDNGNILHFGLTLYSDAIMSAMASQITGVSIVYSTICSSAYQRKHQSSASLAFVREIHGWSVNSPHKGPVTRKMSPFDDVIMILLLVFGYYGCKSIQISLKKKWNSKYHKL